MTPVALSVVVVVVGDNVEALMACLRAADAQLYATDELLLPADGRIQRLTAGLVLPGRVRTVDVARAGALPPHLRAAGVAASAGNVVAVVEDHTAPAPGWRDAIVRAHASTPHTAVGGVIAKGSPDTAAGWAAWLMDYGRYRPGVPGGPVGAVSAGNVSYKRAGLQSCEALWRDEFRETAVHAALRQSDGALWLAPDAEVSFRTTATLGRLASEWRSYGREFAQDRARLEGGSKRWFRLLTAPLVAPLLAWRSLTLFRQLPGPKPALLVVTPALLALGAAWALGEAEGAVST